MQNGNGKHRPTAIDVSRPAKARRAVKRALRDAVVSTQVESLGGAMDEAIDGARSVIVARLEAIEARLGRLERRMLGAGVVAIAVAEAVRYFLES